jgi:hypothetical protein
MLTRDDARGLIAPQVQLCRETVLSCMKLLEDQVGPPMRPAICSRSKSGLINDLMIYRLRQNLMGSSWGHIEKINGMQGILVHGRNVFLRVKKTDQRNRPMNIMTGQQAFVQHTGFLSNLGSASLEVLVLGYQLDRTYSHVLNLTLFPNGNFHNRPWEISIYNHHSAVGMSLFDSDFPYTFAANQLTGTDSYSTAVEKPDEHDYPIKLRSINDDENRTGTNPS